MVHDSQYMLTFTLQSEKNTLWIGCIADGSTCHSGKNTGVPVTATMYQHAQMQDLLKV